DDLDQLEPPSARGAVGQAHRLCLGVHLEPRAGCPRADGEHVAHHVLAGCQVALLMPAVETDLPLIRHCQAPTPRLSGSEYSSSCNRLCRAGSSRSRSDFGTPMPIASQLRLAPTCIAATCSGNMWPNRPCMAR